jgi:hypothetical protein
MECADPRKQQNQHRHQANYGRRDYSHGEISPVQSVGHAANINASYSERLFYGAYMTVKHAASW